MEEHDAVFRNEVQAQCERVAAAIAMLSIGEWPGWIAFILEALEGKTGDSQAFYGEMLADVAKDIETRRTEGRW